MDIMVHEALEWKGNLPLITASWRREADMHWLQGENWTELLKEVVTFNSVEEFWGVYVCFSPYFKASLSYLHLPRPSNP